MIPNLKVGQSILEVLTVSTWNKIAAALNRVQALEKLVTQLSKSGPVSPVTALVSNDTGGDLDQFSIVRLDGLKLTDASTEIILDYPPQRQPFSGKSIDNTTQWHKLAIIQQPLKDGEIGIAIVSGISYALVQVTDASHIRAYPNGTSCKSGAGPLRILYAPNPDEKRAAIVVFDYGTQHYLATAASNIAAAGSGNVTIQGTSISIAVTNVSSEAVTAGNLLGVQEESCKGSRYINWEECDEA